MLRFDKKNFEDEELPHELFLTTRHLKYKMPMLSKAQIPKIIQSGGSFASFLGNLGKKYQQILWFL